MSESYRAIIASQDQRIVALEAEVARLRKALGSVIAVEERLAAEGVYQSHEDGESYRIAKHALAVPAAGAERAQQLEEQNRLAHELLQRIDETEASDRPMPACVDRQNAAYEAWRTVVEKVGEE